jgi:hypothetical protein
MLNENLARHVRSWSQWTAGRLLTGSLAGTFVVLSAIGPALEVSGSASRYAGESSESAVNRALKGDRSVVTRMVRTVRFRESDVRNEPIIDVKLAVGCEPFVSALADIELARIARRCVS